jgi:hypothetical protein
MILKEVRIVIDPELLQLIAKIEQLAPQWRHDSNGYGKAGEATLSNRHKVVVTIITEVGYGTVGVGIGLYDPDNTLILGKRYPLKESYRGRNDTHWLDIAPAKRESAEYLRAWFAPKLADAARKEEEKQERDAQEVEKARLRAQTRFFDS